MQILSVLTMPVERKNISFGVNPGVVKKGMQAASNVMNDVRADLLPQEAAAAVRAQALISPPPHSKKQSNRSTRGSGS